MNALYYPLIILHVAGGTLGLAMAVLAMSVPKGGVWHRRAGLAFFWGMVATGVSAIGLSILHPNPFLGCIGVFSLYLTLSGRRALAWRRLDKGLSTSPDAALQLGMLVGGLAMLSYAGYLVSTLDDTDLAIILAVFGLIGLSLVWRDYRVVFKGRRPDKFWLKAHVTKMLAAAISAYTAFGVVNMSQLPGIHPLLIWLGPTVVGSAVISYWMVKIARGWRVKAL